MTVVYCVFSLWDANSTGYSLEDIFSTKEAAVSYAKSLCNRYQVVMEEWDVREEAPLDELARLSQEMGLYK